MSVPRIVVLPGDGIGPEIVGATRNLLEALGEFEFDERLVGGVSIDEHGTALTDEVLEACRAADAVLLGAVGGPKWDTTDPDAPAPRAGPARTAQGNGPVRQPAAGAAEPRPGRRQPAARGADRRHRPARRPRADRRHLLRRLAAATATPPTTTARTRSPRSTASPAPPSRPPAAATATRPASPRWTRPTCSRPRASGGRWSAAWPAITRTSSSTTCSSTTPPCSSSRGPPTST